MEAERKNRVISPALKPFRNPKKTSVLCFILSPKDHFGTASLSLEKITLAWANNSREEQHQLKARETADRTDLVGASSLWLPLTLQPPAQWVHTAIPKWMKFN